MSTKNFLFLLLPMVALLSFSAVHAANVKQTRNVTGFTAIKVSTGIELYLKMGSQEQVVAEADDEVINDLVTEVKDGTLHIYQKNKSIFNWNWGQSRNVYVTVKTLVALDASSGAEVKGETLLRGDKLTLDASSGSEMELELEYTQVAISASSGSDALLAGQADQLKVDVSSGSDVDASKLTARIVYADASSGADSKVKATAELHAKASSGGDVSYSGNPPVTDVHESSGGDISRE